MKKFSKKVKSILAIAIALVCVLAIAITAIVVGKKDKKRLRLHVDFLYSKDVKLDEAVRQLQERSLSVLKDAMGISDITRVEIVVRKTFVLGELPEDFDEKTAEPEKKPEVTEPAE